MIYHAKIKAGVAILMSDKVEENWAKTGRGII